MKIIFKKKNLLDGLSKIYPIIPERSTIPVLSNILIETNNGRVHISASDIDISATVIGEADVKEEGAITVPGRKIYDIVRELPSLPIEFITSNTTCRITCGNGKYVMPGITKEEYPGIMTIGKGESFNISSSLLVRLTDLTKFAISKDTMTPILTGCLFDLREDEIRMVATDGHKLALMRIENGKTKKPFKLVIGEKATRHLSKLSGSIDVKFDEQKIGFFTENTIIVTRVLEGEFPDYESVIPRNNDKIIVVSRDELISSLKRVYILSDPVTRIVKIRAKEGKLILSSLSEIGEANEELGCDYTGNEMEIGYNISYLLETVSKIESSRVKILLKEPNSAGLFIPTEQKDKEEIIYLLMPVILE
jgi:DNA polymerase-3 subunit beta